MAKRAFDILFSLLGLLVLGPFIGLLALVIRLNSPGPGYFSQTRVGRHGATFTCYKLRTMYRNTPTVPTHEASANFVTPLGQWLRRTRLDELPQLYNVLTGTMSFVGPRPCLTSQTELIGLRKERGVLAVRPGITGLAQIRGVDMSDPPRLVEIEDSYIRSANLLIDIRIILATIFKSARRSDFVRP